MEAFEAIQTRKSVRSYDNKEIPEEVLNKVLEAGRLAPSAINLQPWHFIVVRDAEKRKAMSSARFAKFLAESPIVIVGCADKKRSAKWCIIDTTIALQNMVIAATAEGLGTCWVGSFDENELKSLLKIPENFTIVALIALGYPKEKIDIGAKLIRARNRKSLQDIVSFDEYGKSRS